MRSDSSRRNPLREKHIDAWMKQSELTWRTVYTTPAFAVMIFAGWYVLSKEGESWLSIAVLAAGVGLMVVQWLIVNRMTLYLKALRKEVGVDLPNVPNLVTSVMGFHFEHWPGHRLAQSIPAIFIALFIGLIIFSVGK